MIIDTLLFKESKVFFWADPIIMVTVAMVTIIKLKIHYLRYVECISCLLDPQIHLI